MTQRKPYDDLEIIGNPDHAEKVIITERIDYTSKMYTFPDMMSKLRFLKMIKESTVGKSITIKDISPSLN